MLGGFPELLCNQLWYKLLCVNTMSAQYTLWW